MVFELQDTNKARGVFADWQDLDASISACLDGLMGSVLVTDTEDPKSACAVIGDYAFFAGEPDMELLRGKPDRRMLVVPENEAWAELIENNFAADKCIRYALKKDTVFDRENLERLASRLREGYSFRRMDGELYDICAGSGTFGGAVRAFASKEQYLEYGRGVAVMKEGNLVCAASSYSRSRSGIDIEIDTLREERNKGLASAAAARLILDCLDEGLHPAWDAANKMSLKLAQKLGFEFSREYVCYWVE